VHGREIREQSCTSLLKMSALPKDRLSLVVGVTGHRDIAADDEAPLRASFARILQHLAQTCPHSPLLVLSGLAAGADSLAAEEAMARGIPVMACLPMPVDEYEKDFSTSELERFRSILARCERVVVTSLTRENGYVATGRFIAQYSQLLVAFWDGATSRGAGGTADVIETRVGYVPDVGPVDVIVTPRTSAARPADAFSTRRLYPEDLVQDDAAASFEAILARIDTYNTDLSHTPSRAAEPGLSALMDRSDAAANRLQRRTNLFQAVLFACALVAAAIQVIGHLPPILKVAALVVAFGAYGLARKNDYENRYQDYRAIAEGLRVQAAWWCAGLGYRLVVNEYLQMQAGELQWIRLALRFFYLLYCTGRECPGGSFQHPVCREWVQSQLEYYGRAARREARLKRRLDAISAAALSFGILCTIVCGALLIAGLRSEWLTNLLTVPFVMAAVLMALFTHYEEKQNLAGNARRYSRMHQVFDRARRDLLDIERGGPGDPKEILYELGRAALAEHADWLVMRRDRPLNVIIV
jgi:Flp pilus assembly protein TadB